MGEINLSRAFSRQKRYRQVGAEGKMKKTIAISVSALALLGAAQANAADMSGAPSGGYKDGPAHPSWLDRLLPWRQRRLRLGTRKSSLTPNDPIAMAALGGSFGGTALAPRFGVNGALGGLQAGYNYQLTDSFLPVSKPISIGLIYAAAAHRNSTLAATAPGAFELPIFRGLGLVRNSKGPVGRAGEQ